MSLLPPGAPATAGEIEIAARPLRWGLARVALASAVMVSVLLALRALPTMDPGWHGVSGPLVRGLVRQTVLLAVVLGLTAVLVGLRNVGLRLRGAGVSLVISLPALLLSYGDHLPAVPDVLTLLVAVTWAIGIGLTEEIYGRGLLVTLLGGRRRPALAIVGSSIAFGYLHLPKYVDLVGWEYGLIRSTASAAFSGSAAVIRLRSGSVAGPIALHAFDAVRYLLSSPTSPGASGIASWWAIGVGVVWSAAYWIVFRRSLRDGRGTDAGPRPLAA